MKRWLLLPLGALAVVLVWPALDPERREAVTSAVGLTAAPQPAAKANPICASPVNRNVAAPTDCIPQHLANLPPDPGEAGKVTIDGIDVDKDGVRDDVQRWIAENWGHSQLAVKALTIAAQDRQHDVHHGDDLGKAETRKRGPESMRKTACISSLETKEMLEKRAFEKVGLQVTNTPERWKRARDYDQLFANSILAAFDGTPAEACGFDPAALAARSGEQTISAQLAEQLAAEQAAEEAAEQAGKKEEGQ
jgi:hypothetical protein